MLTTKRAWRGMVTAPHHLASEAGLSVLKEGGNAAEAMVAMAAAIAVVYPHMNSIGGDGFWLIAAPGEDVIGIDACGAAAEAADITFYRDRGLEAIPERGPLAALTVAGTVSGWDAALDVSGRWGGTLPLPRLVEDAVRHGRDGIAVTAGQQANTAAKLDGLTDTPGFTEAFLIDGAVPAEGARFRQKRLAETLEQLGRAGLDDFYRGDLAVAIAKDLAAVGSPVSAQDLARHAAQPVTPLSTEISAGTLYNMPPPTQGLASLMILALFDRLGVAEGEGFDHIHGLIEATKRAFLVRDRHVTDPGYMTRDARDFLDPAFLDAEAAKIDRGTALPWPQRTVPGDTVWLGAIDGAGRAVSFIQSLYWEFGSGVVLPTTGILWQNRGISFALDDAAANPLMPGRKPFHTLNPALARLADGRAMVYGNMGGEGQPQSQSAVFTRHVLFGQGLQAAVTAPRWLLGRTWGDESMSLKLEDRFDPALVQALRDAGHAVELLGPFDDLLGHAGAIVRHPDGLLEGASDPRSDGAAMGF
ncbi:MAG: gamma-glutamyltransferase family protein [Alphaproteobacteria bacterium]|nr:gamma-glutamyltransferase family protein [Alphaproteobacteria bacterium]